MNLRNANAEIFIPDGRPADQALGRVTHAAVAAHQDDIEIMAYHGILECYGRPDRGFMAVTVSDGAGSPRMGPYASVTDSEMQAIRRGEQKVAATLGHYAVQAFLCHPTEVVKDPNATAVADDIADLLGRATPSVVYTHNLADKHPTHVGVALRTLAALRRLPAESRPRALYGCEVWRDLDWLDDTHKVVLDVSNREHLAAALLGVFDSQVAGGKRYDLATLGRRRANATYYASHATDTATGMTYAMDLTPLMNDPSMDPAAFVKTHLDRFAAGVADLIGKIA